jgi:tetratricopeptide (TPR) repeat protein
MSGASNNAVEEAYTDDHGEAEFTRVAIGTYHIVVSGEGIQDSDSGVFEIDERKTTQSIMITVRRLDEGESHNRGSGSVAATDVNVPSEAKSLFVQAGALMAKQSWKEAITKLERAVEIYPKYVGAYTNLGTAYARLGDFDRERRAFNQALAIDPNFAPALLNLGMLETREKHYDAAESLFAKASSADPTNVQILSLLAQCQLLDHHYDLATATAQKVHSMPHDGYAVVHYIAARAFLHENRLPDAVREFELMLKEEPKGARADAVRKELLVLENQPNSRPTNCF